MLPKEIDMTQSVKCSGSITSDLPTAGGTVNKDTDKVTANSLWGKIRSSEELKALGTAVFARISHATDADITDFATVRLRH